MRCLLFFLTLSAVLPETARAEPPRQVEAFATLGISRLAGDESSEGSGAAFGGAVTIPFAARWAVDVQALTSSVNNYANYDIRYTFLSPAIQYRRGNENAYWFIAGGPGLVAERTSGSYQLQEGNATRTVSFKRSDNTLTLHWRTGAVFRPTGRLLIRGEFFWISRYVMPTVGAAVSVGYRFGR